VATLDHAGALGRAVEERLAAFFDTATGGAGKDGWALGASPGEGDVVLALTDAPHLEGIAGVTLWESVDERDERPWPRALGPAELARLAEDAVRIVFVSVEAVA
jgi:hypothetical protein